MSLLPRFPEAETERAFLIGERIERGVAIRALIVISIATLLSYIILNPEPSAARRACAITRSRPAR